MKKTNILIAAAVTIITLTVVVRGAQSGVLDNVDLGGVKGTYTLDGSEPSTPPPPPSIFETLQTFTGKITSITATSVGNYVCKAGEIKLDVRTGFVRGIISTRGLSEDNPGLDALLAYATPAKVTVNTSAGARTILVPGVEAERFKAVMSILHAAKLTNRDVTFQVPTLPVPNCPNVFYVADVSFN
ncbi:MAG TPA: hypothetical protein VFX30_11515 [bacterium]|nr:hypothetical protein [bacterium]